MCGALLNNVVCGFFNGTAFKLAKEVRPYLFMNEEVQH